MKGTQLIFSDLSTPKAAGKEGGKEQENGNAETSPPETLQNQDQKSDNIETGLMESSVYEDIRKKLIVKGVPSEEIAFIHHANTDMQKAELFAKVRSGQVRILLGSTQKMGAGTNVQSKLIASHDLDIQVTKLKMLKSNHLAQKYEMEDRVHRYYPDKLKETQLYIDCLNADIPLLQSHPVKDDAFSMAIMGTVYTERKEAGQAIVAACRLLDDPEKSIDLGEYRGFPMQLNFNGAKFTVTMKQHLTYTAELSNDITGNIARINNALEKIPQSLENHKQNLIRFQKELESAKEEAARPFPQEEELMKKSTRLAELNIQLDQEEKNGGADPVVCLSKLS